MGSLAEFFFPIRCPGCGLVGSAPCTACAAGFVPPEPLARMPEGVDVCRSLVSYEGTAGRMVAGIKYRNDRSVVPWFAAGMADLCRDVEIDLVTWAPGSATRRRRNGIDHGEVIARAVGRELGRPVGRVLRRVGSASQTAGSRLERHRGPELTCRIDPPPAVLIVDDVLTTGATVQRVAECLRRHGATAVHAVTAARTSDVKRP